MPARLHLWAETLTALGLARDGLRRVRPPLEKFALPVASDGPTEALALGRIFVFVDEPGAFACEIGAGAEKLLPLRGAGYCGRFMKGMGRGAQHFRHCVALAHQAEVFRVSGAQRLGSIDALADELERRLLA